ncbi:MAG TPA: hypothetical protein VEP71_01000, partial [Gallionella sp.]|nr:hypothetical protein [Gallionella sp.]
VQFTSCLALSATRTMISVVKNKIRQCGKRQNLFPFNHAGRYLLWNPHLRQALPILLCSTAFAPHLSQVSSGIWFGWHWTHIRITLMRFLMRFSSSACSAIR